MPNHTTIEEAQGAPSGATTGFHLPAEAEQRESATPSGANDDATTGDGADNEPWQQVLNKLHPIAGHIVSGGFEFGGVRCEAELKNIQEIFPTFTLESLKTSLKKLVSVQSEIAGINKSQDAQDPKLADEVVGLVLSNGCTLFHDHTGATYVTMPVNNHQETWKLRSLGFKRWVRNTWLQMTGTGLSSAVVGDALDTLDAKAIFDGAEHEAEIRVAHANGNIYVDLCNETWQTVEITSEGWHITGDTPIKFIRTPGMLPLAVPIPGGRLDQLRTLINVPTDEIWYLIVAWILGVFSKGPYTILVVTGEQGSAKSFLCRILRQLIDPSEVLTTTSPREARDVIIAAQNSHVTALDNLSGIPGWLSDLSCQILTGAAYRERKYHTNDGDEVLFKAKRPMVINGIDLAIRPDLADRGLLVSLPTIPEANRQDEQELLSRFEAVAPEILGGIFDVLVSLLKHLPTTNLSSKPRMADFALWVTAAETALGWKPGDFMRLYADNRHEAIELTLESDSFGSALLDFMKGKAEPNWHVGWADLINALVDDKPPRDWPKNSKAVATRLRRLAPALRHCGIDYKHVSNGSKRLYHIWKEVPEEPSSDA